jgi:UDP-N-acetylglucosamine/UDP-N-acetyl-alpha-D-glucosaminouronate 4-epimerase
MSAFCGRDVRGTGNNLERYLVTGGAGFIGSHIVETLLSQGHFVRVIDNFDTGNPENIRDFSGDLEVLEGSIADRATVQKAVSAIDYIFHEAARGSVPRSVADPIGTHDANVTGTINLLNAAHEAGVRRVICASSSSVYGETPTLPKEESMKPHPQSPYAVTKLMLEHYCEVFEKVYGLETVCLRYFNIYGPRQNPELQYAAVVPIFIKNMLRNKPCVIYGDGAQTRDFTYVEDCVSANLIAAKHPRAAGNVFNVACGDQISVLDLFPLIAEMTDYNREPVHETSRAGDVRHSRGSTERIRQQLSFQPATSLKKGLEKTIRWYQSRL